ncbi:MAG TPA: hypothetical protein DD640_06695, partial [Clostridiales bacterium]|nr:hypothetical protein [Clostridiales bacterium]
MTERIVQSTQNKKQSIRLMFRLIVPLLVLLVCILACPSEALALSNDYTIIKNRHVPIPETYEFLASINVVSDADTGSVYLNQPSDLFINQEGYLFIADTGNNRIVKMTQAGETAGIFTGPQEKPLNAPEGVYADADGNMFIADTGNARVVHLAADGSFVESFIKPDSKLLDEHFQLNSSKLLVNPNGYIYMLKGENILTIDAFNRFKGYFGQ